MRRSDRRAAPRPALHRRLLARYDDGAGRDELLGVDPAHITMLTRRLRVACRRCCCIGLRREVGCCLTCLVAR